MPKGRNKSTVVPFTNVEIAQIRENPYIQRIIEDAKLRENVRVAFDASRSAYGRLTNGKAPHKALVQDKKLQRDLQQAIVALRDATAALTEPPKKRKAFGLGRKLLIAAFAFGLALAGSEKLRTKVLDAVFGKEEEFEYTPPPPAPSTPPSSPVGAP